jgi:hypothetical protein
MRASPLFCWIAGSILLVFVSACGARRQEGAHTMESVASGAVAPSLVGDDLTAAAFRVLIDQIIGDSADRVCVSIAEGREDAPRIPADSVDRDPAPEVMRRLRGGRVAVMARSTCADDERNFGPSRGLLRLRAVAIGADGSMTIDADAIGDHFAHYRCTTSRPAARSRDTQCRITSRE